MSERKERCETCRFWTSPKEGEERGICHRFPPMVPVVLRGRVHYLAPKTYQMFWCGEWQEK